MGQVLASLQSALEGRYVLERELGHGGMATVYLARDLRHDRPVALKVLHPELAASLGPERFLREIRLTARLQHPHILPLHDSGEVAGQLWYTMPYVEGESLRERLTREHRLPLEETLQLAREVAEAFGYAHGEGVIHRDIKPENILLSRGHVLIIDFGVALALTAAGGDPLGQERLTELGLAIGSPGYMSPEQLLGEPVGGATDVFSLGVVLYEALTGHQPFRAESRFGMLHAVLGQVLMPPSSLEPEVPEALETLVLRMLGQDPRLRPSVTEVGEALAQQLTGRRTGAPRRAGVSVRRHSVGRANERAQLRAALEAIVASRGLLVCVTGEPGIGKTTIVEDFLAELSEGDEAPCVARGHCSERLAGSEAYLPFLEALEGLLEGEFRESAARLMKVLAPTWYGQVIPPPPDNTSGMTRPAASSAVSQERLKRELASFLQELSRLRPVVIFFDDVHWADASTVDLIAYLATRFDSALLMLVTYRPSELLLGKHPFLQVKLDLQGRGLCREVPLQFLAPVDIWSYIDLEFPRHQFPPSLPALIHAKTEGSPLFMVDLLRYLLDRGVVARADDGWRLAQSVPEIEHELPETVRGMIEKKIAQLGEADRQLLVAASVQGHRFDSATVAQVLALDAAEVEERLQALERVHGFVRPLEEQEFPDGTPTLRYEFVHVLYQNALYGSLTPTRRTRLSAAVAETLLGFYGEQSPSIATELALLLEAARDLPRAADYFLLGAQNAARVFAYREAVALVQRGLALVERLPETPERTRRESMFWITLGSLLTVTEGGGDPDVEAAYRRAQELSTLVGESAQLFTALRGLSEFYHTRGPRETALSYAEQALAVAQRLGDPALIVDAHHAVAMPLLYLGELERAREQLERGIALYHPEQRRGYGSLFYHAIDPGVGCRYQASRVLWLRGHPDQARAHAEEGITLAQRISHALSLAWMHAAAATVHQCRRELRLAEEHAASALGLSREHEWPEITGWGLAWHGWAVALQGRPAAGIAELREGLAALEGHTGLKPHLVALLAEALRLGGCPEEALAVVAEALAASETCGRYYWAELHRLKGELLLSGPLQYAEAERCFRQALEVARQQRAKSLELRAATSLGRLWQQQGRTVDGRELVESVYGWFAEGLDTADLREAQQLITSLS